MSPNNENPKATILIPKGRTQEEKERDENTDFSRLYMPEEEPLPIEVRRAMSFDETVERYRSQIKPNETQEESAARINRFRCGY